MKTKLLIAMLVCGIVTTSNAESFRLLTLEAQSNEIEPQVFPAWLCVSLAVTFVAAGTYIAFELRACAKKFNSNTNTNTSAFSYIGPASGGASTNGNTVIHFEGTTNFIDWFAVGSTTGRIDSYYFLGTNYFMENCFFRAWY